MHSTRVTECRLCRGPMTDIVLDLGAQPISNRLTHAEDPNPERYRLAICLCQHCGMPQLSDGLPSTAHFHDNYVYVSGASTTWIKHCEQFAADVIAEFALGPDDMVLELGSNDGTLLKAFADNGIAVHGIEPSGNVAQIARDRGIETTTVFFDAGSAAAFADEYGRPAIIIANNVLAHVPDTGAFLRAARDIVRPGGLLCFEFPHNLRILEQRYFDTIYHEHYTYLGVTPLQAWARANGMAVFDVVKQPTHGGSLRLFLCREGERIPAPEAEARIADLIASEVDVASEAAWQHLDASLREWKQHLLAMIDGYRSRGLTVAGYAAASKATVLCNYVGLTAEHISCCADASRLKQGFHIPGTGIPIVSPAELARSTADVVVVFAWNIFDEICDQLGQIMPEGTRIVRPLPSPLEVQLRAVAT